MNLVYKLIVFLVLTSSFTYNVAIQAAVSSHEARSFLLNHAYAHILAKAIHVAADMKIADQLQNSEKTIGELATALKVDEDNLYRLMRVLVSHQIFNQDSKGKYHLTQYSQLLRSDVPDSLQAALAKEMDDKRWGAVNDLKYAIQTGESSFEHKYGMGFYDYLQNNPEAAERFNLGMKNFSQKEDEEVVKSYDFGKYKTIIDVGSGQGSLAKQLLTQYPNIKVILFDLPHVVASAIQLMKNSFDKSRYQIKSGNFFTSIPKAGDLYILKRVLHNWSDTKCIQLLTNIANSVDEKTRVLIIDAIIPSDQTPSLRKDLDLQAMILGEGRERTLEEFKKIVGEAGFELVKTHPVSNAAVSIIELKKLNH